MKSRLFLGFLLLMVLGIAQITTAEIFHLKDGTIIRGTIENSDETSYTVKTNFGTITLQRDQIQDITYEQSGDKVNVDVNFPDEMNVNVRNRDQRVGSGAAVMTIGGGLLGGCSGLLLGALVISNNDHGDDGDIVLISGLAGIALGAMLGWNASKPDDHEAGLLNITDDTLALGLPQTHVSQTDDGTNLQMTMMRMKF